MAKKSVLDKVMNMPDRNIADDDHPNKPDITQKEYIQALKEIVDEHEDDPKVKPKEKVTS